LVWGEAGPAEGVAGRDCTYDTFQKSRPKNKQKQWGDVEVFAVGDVGQARQAKAREPSK